MKKLFILLLSTSVLISCSDDFTDIDPVGSLNDASLQNATGVDLLLTGAYSVLDGHSNAGGSDWSRAGDNWWMDVLADDAHKGSSDGDQADLLAMELYTWDTNNPYFLGKWRALFAGVNRANAVIDLINKSKRIWLWLPTRKKTRLYNSLKNKKNIPVSLLNKKKLKVFSIQQ